MQCVEFETRLNDLLDRRVAPSVDTDLVDHAQRCARCSELLAAHEALLEGVAAMPVTRLAEAERLTMAYRIVAEVGSAPVTSFQRGNHNHASDHQPLGGQRPTAASPVELAAGRAVDVATTRAAPLALVGFVVAAAAALLIAVLPWFRGNPQPAGPANQEQFVVGSSDERPAMPVDTTGVLQSPDDLALIARVGYQVADGLTPVTNSMVSALRELRKRPLFRNPEEGRSSSYFQRDVDQLAA
jgi:hypothetical protein